MKTTLKITIWAIYICALPVLVVFSIGMLLYSIFGLYRDCGEVSWADIKDLIKALFDGYKEGHAFNMLAVENYDK